MVSPRHDDIQEEKKAEDEGDAAEVPPIAPEKVSNTPTEPAEDKN